MTVLVTGFEPFGADAENASEQVVTLLAETWDDPEIRLVAEVLPVSFAEVDARLDALVAERRPDAVVAVGEAGGRIRVTPESTARNLDDARIPDNAGDQPRERPIDPDGPATLPSRIDPHAVVRACLADGIAAEVSDDAGAFLCNHVLHSLLARTDLPAGFVHVPALRSAGTATVGAETDPDAVTGAAPEVSLADCARAVGHAVRTAAAQV